MGRAFEYRRKSKEKRWDTMSKVFPKLAKAITLATKEAGPDPETNSKLRTAIINAKAENMPKDNIESAIKRASGKDAQDFTEITYEGKGPHGVLILVECATDNTNRTISNLKTIFNKNGGQIMTGGSMDFLFARQAVIEFEKTDEIDLDMVELELIDAGLEELEVSDNTVYAYGDFTSFRSLSDAVENLGIEIKKASLQRTPTSPIELTDEQMEDLDILIDKIEDDDDVQAVYTNVG